MKYYLWVLGCAMNYSDAERIGTVLNLLGCEKTDKENDADIIITVACSVRQKAIDRIHGKVKVWQKEKKKRRLLTLLSGCVLPNDKKKMAPVFDLMFEITELDKLTDFVKQKQGVKKTETTKASPSDYLSIHPQYESTFRAFVPIMTGCNNFCSYCAVPYTRGREKSRSQAEILAEVEGLVRDGYKEITLLGQNVNSYAYGFCELLSKIDNLKGDFRVYFYSNHPKDMSDELINLLPKLKHFPQYLHLPLQSGNTKILKAMNRQYTEEDYLKLVAKIRKAIPGVTLTTDIIVGYPGEGEKEFADTVLVMEKAKFDMAFLAQYSPRPGTVSAKIPETVTKKEKADRERVLTDILAKTSYENNKSQKGKNVRVLIDSEKNGKLYGRTDSFKVVEIEGDTKTDLIGRFLEVCITRVEPWKLFGSIIKR